MITQSSQSKVKATISTLQVLQTFLSFLLWYSLFIMAFGLGFYIMLHKVIDARLVDNLL